MKLKCDKGWRRRFGAFSPSIGPRPGEEGRGDPRAPQEAPRGSQETPKPGQEDSRPSKIAPRGSKRHRRRLRSPKSKYPNSLAPNRRMKKGGRAAVIPLGEVNPPPAPEGRELRRVGHLDASAEVAKGAKFLAIDLCILVQIFFGGVFGPP